MAQKSTLIIDGREISGTAAEISSVYLAVSRAIDSIVAGGHGLVLPLTGTTGEGQRMTQIVRLRAESTLYVGIVDDGTVGDEFVDLMAQRHEEFMKNFGPGSVHDDVESGASADGATNPTIDEPGDAAASRGVSSQVVSGPSIDEIGPRF